MTHPIIKTDNYLLITSEEEIKSLDAEWGGWWHGGKKVIAHLPLNNSPIREGVPLLPPLPPLPMTFPTIECIGDNLWEELTGGQEVSVNRGDWSFGFGIGYNKAKEKYKFTEDDMRKALSESFKASQEGYQITSDEIISSLSQPKLPVGFKCEISKSVYVSGGLNELNVIGDKGLKHHLEEQPKIINGVMQGEWIFE